MNMFLMRQESNRPPRRASTDPAENLRAARFARWERVGVELVKADLRNGGRFIVGGGARTRAMAEEWLRLKDAEKLERAAKSNDTGRTVSHLADLLRRIRTETALRLEHFFRPRLHQH